MLVSRTVALAAAVAVACGHFTTAQQPGTQIPEKHPPLASQVCTRVTDVLAQVDQVDSRVVKCVTEKSSVVIDANWRQMNAVGTNNSCNANSEWNSTTCSTPEECAKICGLEGADYAGKHSITTAGQTLKMKLETPGGVGTRVYMLDASGKKYKQFQLLNQEFTFDVDMSLLPCGSNGALYFSKMDADGGTARFPTNSAGAAYGTGYCDAQCMKDVKFINGEANLKNTYGSCCAEMDIWEANSMATAYTTHPCSVDGQERCSADEDCGATEATRYTGWCDKPGCGLNPFRMGNKKLYGRGKEFDIDTTRPFTVVTQFVTDDDTETGELVEIRRLYKQDDRVVANPGSTWPALNGTNSITETMCNATNSFFGGHPYAKGGLAQMGKQMVGGMTLAMSIWVDYGSNMTWLDSYKTGEDPTVPGAMRGGCPNPGGDPESVFAESPDAAVKFTNIRSGDFGSTY
ncbi:Exoglucanase 1 [Phytophthora rubi]|uniref:cellulose 1,4-beta-cellobiosidase (non-reducing end) n=1 Tax=Phytophthora rubi TaxID=129364 RepID=A0A6A3H6H4_9STRA|nr:Exoglucanase 1 [Phytophthora rubi]KAE8990910.1 Exoglucanase 1 [Phytophthora rubi]KAE9301527.1 Exoglucanase 1 [Phytophthora rubi]